MRGNSNSVPARKCRICIREKYKCRNLSTPKKLVSLAKLAAEFGYNAEHLRQLAVQKRLRAWLISDAMWVTTRQNLVEYMDSRKATGRRRARLNCANLPPARAKINSAPGFPDLSGINSDMLLDHAGNIVAEGFFPHTVTLQIESFENRENRGFFALSEFS